MNPAASARGEESGFVLVMVLVLIALLTILVAVSSMLSQIERRAAANASRTEQARQNALFALNVAIGQLQKNAGPDQRITARAEILSGNATVAQPYWTGVWKSSSSNSNVSVLLDGTDKSQSLRQWSLSGTATGGGPTWLVSGSGNLDPKSFASGTNTVLLATNLSGSSTVSVPLVPMASGSASSKTIGKYGYWVSDEGVKAKVTLQDSNLNTNPSTNYVANQLHFLAPPANAAHKVLPDPLSTDFRNNSALSKITSLASLKLLPATSPSGYTPNQHSPDLTPYSWGVIADVRNGGLKKDLTAAFEDDRTTNPTGQFLALKNSCGTGQDSESVFRSNNAALCVPVITVPPFSANPTVLDGLRWQSLYQYYNLYKSVSPMWKAKVAGATATAPAGIPNANIGFPASSPYVLQQRFARYNDGGTPFDMDPICPMVIEARVDIALVSFVDPGTGKYRLRLRYYPFLTLYNPFSTRITADEKVASYYEFYNNYFNLNGRWTTYINVNGVGIPPFSGNGCSLIQGAGYPLNLLSKVADAATFEPGEIKVFGLAADSVKTTFGEPRATNVCAFNELVNSNPNLSADFAQTYDIPWEGTSDPSAIVSVIEPNQIMTANVVYQCATLINEWPDGTGNHSRRMLVPSLPEVRPIGTWPKISISQMNGTPYLIVGFNMRSKGIGNTSDTNYFNYKHHVPTFMGNNVILSDVAGGMWKEVYARSLRLYSSVHEVQMDGAGHTSWGAHSVGVDPVSPSNSRIVLYDIPCQPMTSLGQFAHLSQFYYAGSGAGGNLYLGADFVGGSFCSPVTKLENNVVTSGASVAFDNSFMANQVLFDTYFFSTVPAANQAVADSAKYVMTSGSLAGAVNLNLPLPNKRMGFYYKDGVIPSSSTNPTITQYMTNLRDLKKAAANLVIDGAFNVNSTSIDAWRSLLSSLSGNSLKMWNYRDSAVATLSSGSMQNPIPRFWNISTDRINQPWDGMRALSDAEVTELATRIVQQIKARGPFLSMGDFLNRRLTATGTLNSMGALQAAIESTSPDINAVAKAAGMTTSMTPAPASPVPLNTATGIPGYLMQQDIVQAFAPVMTTRSDTFVIRCYGEADNQKTGATEGRAWCEAVVQRVPDFVDQNDPAVLATGDAASIASLNSNNQTFGRRFKIASFRWLNQTDL